MIREVSVVPGGFRVAEDEELPHDRRLPGGGRGCKRGGFRVGGRLCAGRLGWLIVVSRLGARVANGGRRVTHPSPAPDREGRRRGRRVAGPGGRATFRLTVERMAWRVR